MKKKNKVAKASALVKQDGKFMEKVTRFCNMVSHLASKMDLTIRELYYSLKALEKTCEIQDKEVSKVFNKSFGKTFEEVTKETQTKLSALDKAKVKKATMYIG
jgi:hypothetical protein